MKRALNVLSVAVMIVTAVAFVAVFGTEAYAASSNGMINAGADVLKNGTNTKDAQLVHMGDRYWYVIGYDKEGVAAGSGEMSLLSKESIKSTPFDKNYKTVYNSSNLKNDIEAYINEKFSDGEKSAIAARELPAVTLKQTGNYDWWENNYHTIDAVMDEPVHGALLWPLSAKEAGALNGDIRKTESGDYWLRSLGVPEYEEWVWYGLEEFDVYTTPAAMAIVNAGGNVAIQGEKENTTWWKGMRPAFKLKKGDVILTTAPNGKLSGDDGSLTPCQESSYSDNKWKLTLRDEGRNSFHVDPCNVEFGEEGSITVKYYGAKTGDNEYISAIIKGADGSVKAYGRIAKATAEDGTATITGLPNDEATGKAALDEGDKLYVFNEQYNGDEKTDFSSALTEISFTGHDWEFYELRYDIRAEKAIAEYHCRIDGNHHKEVEAEKEEKTVDATCEEKNKDYRILSISADKSLDGKAHSKSIFLREHGQPLGHDYTHYFGFRWTGDATSGYKKAEAIFACDRDFSHKTYVEGVVTEKVQEPTCTAIGRTLYQATLSADKSLDGKEHGEAKYAKAKPRLGHDWGEVTYTWASDNSSVTAKRVCKRDSSHVETETVETEATNITKAPTCANTGTGDIKTKPFTNEAFQEQTKTNVELPVDPNAHVWDEGEKQGDPNSCGGYVTTFKCTLCKAEKEEIIGGNAHDWTDYIVDYKPTCTEPGEKSRHCNNCQAHDLDGIETIAPTGHDWEFKNFTWTGDDTKGYEAVANYECKTDNSHKMTVNAEITEEVIDPTCQKEGKTVYTATISAADSPDKAEHSARKDANPTEKVSHEWKYDSIVWPGSETEDYTEAYAKYTCEYSCEETAKVEAQITEKETEADCDSAGKITYTATVTADNSLTGVEHNDTQEVKTAEALGHDWEFKDFIWTGDEKKGYTKVLAKYGCKRDPEHEGLFEAKISEDVVEPTCTEKGCTVYVAEIGSNDSLDGNEYVDYKTAKNVSPAHKWGPWRITRKATSRAAGEMTRTCTVCKKKEADKLLLVAKGIAKGKTKATFSWNKVKTADRYVVYLAKCSYKGKSYKYKKIKTVSGKTLKLTKKKLRKNTAYKFYVVAQKKMGGKYTTIAKSKGAHFFTGNVRGKLTNPKAIKLSKSALTIKKGKSAKIKASVTKVKKSKKLATGHAVKLRYISNDPRIATVSAKGKVKAKKKGTCIIYVQAANGIWKTCKVTVK